MDSSKGASATKTEDMRPSLSASPNASPSGTMAAMPSEAKTTTPPTIPMRSHLKRLFCFCMGYNIAQPFNKGPH
jgi:hypothetical protein